MRGLCVAATFVSTLVLQGCGSGKTPSPSPSPSPSPTPAPGHCSDALTTSGCQEGTCQADSTCQCVPGRRSNGHGGCMAEAGPVAVEFHVYRVASKEYEDIANDNVASARGILHYLHTEVVQAGCQPPNYVRPKGVDRVMRFKVTMHNTQQVYTTRQSQFGPYVSFTNGKCMDADCDGSAWTPYGYVIGCQSQRSNAYGVDAMWMSVPGQCPSQEFNAKTTACSDAQPGGECKAPSGGRSCTWSAEKDGEIMLDELEGITNYEAFCMSANVEYDPATDKGTGCSFWDGMADTDAAEKRVAAFLKMFDDKFPGTSLPTPVCDWDPVTPPASVVA